MSTAEKNSNLNYETPKAYTYGWVSIFIGSIPLLLAVRSNDKKTYLVAGIFIIIGGLLLIIGKIQSSIFLKKNKGQKAAVNK